MQTCRQANRQIHCRQAGRHIQCSAGRKIKPVPGRKTAKFSTGQEGRHIQSRAGRYIDTVQSIQANI